VASAPGLEDRYQAYKDRGLVIMTLIGENSSSSAPSVSDLDYWASAHGQTFPVLSDPGFNQAWNYMMHESDGTIYMPNNQLIGPGMEVIAVNEYTGISTSLIEANLP
jgi:hypothetical protein